ncbi:hypothetical protein COUCH_15390 [Couchioplanes caeruleus]|uniref:RHS repeat-associated core domain-containing protein n=1 Tax=Couchioplanes caeruleus TaxID=56438 RepID=UPI0020C14AE4|nr:RHS repeat-associated core domain-containing protein [Couchioplanes caeruleus]UQU67566.1 hypothetical protein COUCH_15390 [Couchioplanes caeruleus]
MVPLITGGTPSRFVRNSGTWRRRFAAGTLLTLMAALLHGPQAAQAQVGLGSPAVPKPHVDKVQPFTTTAEGRSRLAQFAKDRAATAASARRAMREQARAAAWPTPGTADLTVPSSGTAATTAGSLPITLAAALNGNATARARVTVLDQQQVTRAGVQGVVVSVVPTSGHPGRTSLRLSYAGFANLYGGDFGGRLELVRLPACALTTPEKAACRTRTPEAFDNERAAQRITSTVDLSAASTARPVVLALTAGTKSGGGNYGATPLTASSSWEAGGSAGAFSWNYPLRMPPAAAGPSPSLTISYNSASVDGQTSSSNNQGTLVGSGFDITSSYVERSYNSCDDDGHDGKEDLCWKYDNATLVLNGKSSELVMDDPAGTRKPGDGKPEVWRLKDDDGTKVEHLTGADNQAHGGEYWRVTTGDGAQYTFGLAHLPGAGKDDDTKSVWTVPVFGDDADEPCHGDTFDASNCTQAWRWNLDYVVDTHRNAMSYWYTAEHNNYAKNGKDKPGTDYVRGGYLNRIEYGQRDQHLFDPGAHAPQKVVFDTDERCLVPDGCGALTHDTMHNWPDVPFDSLCADGESCVGRDSPAFFTRRRLTGLTTYFWNGAGYQSVDSWDLHQKYLDPGDIGDSSDQSLWLDSITHTGHIGGTDIAMDPVVFTHTWRTNRVDKTDDILPLNKPRLNTISSETGALTTVTYSEPDCDATPEHRRMPAAEDDNTLRCFPVRWRPNGGDTARKLDWFHKYVVTDVRTTDPTGGSRPLVYHYDYSGPAWHYTEDALTPPSERTWSQWRGYGKVTTLTGDPGELTQSKRVTVYLQGMNGDRQADGGHRSVKVSGITAPAITDDDVLSGFVREQVTYNGINGAEASGTVNDPWFEQTAKRHFSWLDVVAGYVRTGSVHSRTRITSGTPPTERSRTITTSFDHYGVAAAVEDQGDTGKAGDETCTRTWYARNPDRGITTLVSRIQTLATLCKDVDKASLPANPTTTGDVVSDAAVAYDGAAWSEQQKPTKGEVSWTGRTQGYTTARAPIWQTVTTSGFDALGRETSRSDALSHTRTTQFIPAGAGPLTRTVVTDALGYAVTTDLNPALGLPTTITDPNTKTTQLAYDALGRLIKVFLPNVAHPSGQSPNIVYGYHLSATDASWVSTATLRGNSTTKYNTTYQLYDSLLRPRQTQAPSPSGGRLISETFYDSRGQTDKTYGDIYDDTSAPSGQLYGTLNAQAPSETQFAYDGLGRNATSTFLSYGVPQWSTKATYTGDSAATSAVQGGSAAREYTDVFGRVTERRTYAGPNPDSTTYTSTLFTYTPSGKTATITGPDKAVWTYRYDLLGRKTYESDPDKGRTDTTYTELDQIETTKDANQKTLIFDYDELGRRRHEWSGTKSDATLQAQWNYDGIVKGQQDSSTRYVGGFNGKAYTKKVTAFDDMYRPTATQLVLPGDDPLIAAGVPTTLNFSNDYNVDGTPQYSDEPAVAGLPREAVSFGYNSLSMPTTAAGASGYILGSSYTPLGQLQQMVLGTSQTNTKKVTVTNTYEPGTRRLKTSDVTDTTHAFKLQDLAYSYDDAGNTTAITDAATLGGTGQADNQCFAYDGYRRVTEAWTPKSADCAAAGRTTTNLGGPAPYWTSYDYYDAGLRKTETQHAAAGNTTIAYTYGEDGQPPHALTATSTTKPGSTTPAKNPYHYDAAGQTISRPGVNAAQTLSWDVEGKLQSVSEPATGTAAATTTSYLYDADGGLLLRRATGGSGETVLYLGATEVHYTSATKKLSGSRYYSVGSQTVAVRTATLGTAGTKLTFLSGDSHGTASLAIDGSIVNGTPAAQTYTKRYTAPFGAPRGPKATTWPDDKAFLGKPADSGTGLTHMGAREYDPTIGRFLSVDPLLDSSDAQSLNGYAYADNNPATVSDPTGLDGCSTGGQGCVDPDGNGVYAPPGSEGGGTGGVGSDPGTDSDSGSGSGSGTNRGPGGDYTTDHNAAVADAVKWIKARHPELEVRGEYVVAGGSKQKGKGGTLTGNDGRADITAFDHQHKILYVWEVKIARDNQKTPNGFGATENRGPADLAGYMKDLRKQHKDYDVQKGFNVPWIVRDPAPKDPKSVLITVSATLNGRPSPEFDGIVNYYTRKKQEQKQQTAQNSGGEQRGQERSQDGGEPSHSWGWVKPVGGALSIIGGVALLTATVGEDVLTGGAGIADDIVTVPAGVEMITAGAGAL